MDEKRYKTPIYIRRASDRFYSKHREELNEIQRVLKRKLNADSEYVEKRRQYFEEAKSEVRARMLKIETSLLEDKKGSKENSSCVI